MPEKKAKKRLFFGSQPNKGIIIANFSGYFLILCIVVSGFFLYQVFQPFITTLILASIAATAFYPLFQQINEKVKFRSRLAAFLSVVLVLFLIIVPLFIFSIFLIRQTIDTVTFIQAQLASGILDEYIRWQQGGIIYDLLGSIRQIASDFVDFDSIDIKANIVEASTWIITTLTKESANIIKSFGWFLISLFIFIFSMYYFFKDADYIVDKIQTLSPLPSAHEKRLFIKFKEISLATLYGIFFTSIIQGILGGIGFFIAGVPNALFWGTAIGVFSLVPLTGAATIWFPASIVLFAGGNWVGGTILFLWGMIIVSTSDNFVRAYLIGGRTNMNQLMTFLAVFGGIMIFGLPGVIFGPLILNLFFAFLHIYESEYDKVLHKQE
jgi:predicted PurR-regulated permease PerM